MSKPENFSLQPGVRLVAGEPLWKRVPKTASDGSSLTDFMMLIPRLREQPGSRLQQTLQDIQRALAVYGEQVEFADLNLKLNLLWISVRPSPGICLHLSAAIRARVPEAILVASQAEAMVGETRRRSSSRWRFLPRRDKT
ncbi:MAG: hypothetical protein KZQ58_06985 [gamma proteobacterium symbiont of Bathyaustriella thionipta]|nr:hypothetical protein [gamma proteobacterium symbiont of Bathyaustriella thionipta]